MPRGDRAGHAQRQHATSVFCAGLRSRPPDARRPGGGPAVAALAAVRGCTAARRAGSCLRRGRACHDRRPGARSAAARHLPGDGRAGVAAFGGAGLTRRRPPSCRRRFSVVPLLRRPSRLSRDAHFRGGLADGLLRFRSAGLLRSLLLQLFGRLLYFRRHLRPAGLSAPACRRALSATLSAAAISITSTVPGGFPRGALSAPAFSEGRLLTTGSGVRDSEDGREADPCSHNHE